MKNFIPINRKLFDHFLWSENRSYSKFEAWLDLLQTVSYSKDNKSIINGVMCSWGRGQYPVSISFLCTRWGWKDKAVRNYLKLLKNEKMICLDKTNKWTMLTICKYDSYNKTGQAEDMSEGKQETNKGQELKKVNKEKKEINIPFLDFWNLYDKKTDRDKSENKWKNLSDLDRVKIMKYIPGYKISQPDKKYRKNPVTFFNNKSWNDEIIGDVKRKQSRRVSL
jgi:hypothetical protein